MTHTGFWGEANPGGPLAPAAEALPSLSWGYRGGTGLSSTVDDLYRWHLAFDGEAVLRAGSRREAEAPQVERSATPAYGYGWHVLQTTRGTKLVVHTGAEGGLEHHSALYRFVDEEATVVLLSNSVEEKVLEVRRGILETIFPT